MNYINIDFLNKSKLCWDDVLYLMLVKQGAEEHLKDEAIIEKLLITGCVKKIKRKNKTETENSLLRLDKKGKEFLDKLQEAPITNEVKIVVDWLCEIYLGLGKNIGNKAQLTRNIRDFSNATDISKNRLVQLCTTFVNDESQMEYSFYLEYVFWKAPNAFATRFSLENSRLWRYYQERQDYFDNEWEQEKYQN